MRYFYHTPEFMAARLLEVLHALETLSDEYAHSQQGVADARRILTDAYTYEFSKNRPFTGGELLDEDRLAIDEVVDAAAATVLHGEWSLYVS